MNASGIRSLYEGMDRSDSLQEYRMAEISRGLYVGRAYNGEYSLLIPYAPNTHLPSGRSTRGLTLHFFSPHTFTINGKETGAAWAAVVCRESNLNHIFCALAEGAVYRESTGRLKDPRELLAYIEDWQELLASPGKFSSQQYIGLWGELYVIQKMGNVPRAIELWGGPERKKFDFSGFGIDVEVKTSLRAHYHSFSEDQLLPSPSGSRRFILSINVIEDPAGGKTVEDMACEIRKLLTRTEEFEKKLVSAGYKGPDEAYARLSTKQLKAVLASHVPSIRSKDPGVYSIRFDADLTFCPEQSYSEINRLLLQNE